LTVAAQNLSEEHALATLRAELPGWGPGITVGIGDDAAVLAPAVGKQVWTIDACMEDVHFRRAWVSLEDLAHKSLHAAVSDLAAMAAKPVAALVQLTLPPWLTAARLRRLAREQAAVSSALGCPIVGGNLTSGDRLEIVTSALGRMAGRPLLRAGARAGDELWLVGPVGHARLGLLSLERGLSRQKALRAYVDAFRRPRARLAEGVRLGRVAHACMDVSDGLCRDVPRLARASGVKIIVERPRIESLIDGGFARAAEVLRLDPLEELLHGGEDYALLAAGPRQKRPRFALAIGRIEEGEGGWLEAGPSLVPLAGGFQHQSRRKSPPARSQKAEA
jgi:thiamine-monophosphate kinase